jgi:hypothetical protein
MGRGMTDIEKRIEELKGEEDRLFRSGWREGINGARIHAYFNELRETRLEIARLQALESKSKWISVEDSVPTMPFQNMDGRYSQSVLAFIGDGFMRVCYYHDYRWELEGPDKIQVEDVTHWMDLPKPPEESQQCA